MAIITRDKVKTFLGITGTSKDDLIDALIPEVEADFLHIRNFEFDTDSNDDVIYPDNAELISAQMIAYHMTTFMQAGGALTSERVGSYSYTRASGNDMFYGYPKSIVARIKRYVTAR